LKNGTPVLATFRPVIFGWVVHVYPFEKNAADVWSVEKQMDHGD
jgi:hypothetical protein